MNNFKGTKVVVTGGAGFIGSHIVDRLIEAGAAVTVVDDLSTGHMDNIEHALDDIIFIETSIVDTDAMRHAFEGAKYVFHQAAIPSVPRSVAEPQLTNEANVSGTLSVLVAARDAGVSRVVYASSSSVYGDSEELPKVETMEYNPLSPYAAQKVMGEMYGQLAHQLYGLETVGLRYFNVFGPRQDPSSPYSGVISLFTTMIPKGKTPVIYGDGETTRDFTYIANVVDANIQAAISDQAVGKVYNIACGTRISLNDLFNEVCRICDAKIKPKYADERAGDIKHSLADISRAQKDLGFEPQIDFGDGLQRTIESNT